MSKRYGRVVQILVVDDDALIREIAARLLTSAGYDVLTAVDGDEGLELYSRKQPDLIVLDLMMPKVSGFDVVRKIRDNSQAGNTPILIMSALITGEEMDASIRALDVSGFIDKTQVVKSLVSRVEKILSESTS